MQWIGVFWVVSIESLYAHGCVRPSITDVIDNVWRDHPRPSNREVLWVRGINLLSPLRNISDRLCLVLVGKADKNVVPGRNRIVEAAAFLIPVVDRRRDVVVIRRAVKEGAVRRRVQGQDLLAD